MAFMLCTKKKRVLYWGGMQGQIISFTFDSLLWLGLTEFFSFFFQGRMTIAKHLPIFCKSSESSKEISRISLPYKHCAAIMSFKLKIIPNPFSVERFFFEMVFFIFKSS